MTYMRCKWKHSNPSDPILIGENKAYEVRL